MAQSNAAHEPSMEEILASIRRIIETTDGSEDGLTDEPEEAVQPTVGPSESSVLNRIKESVANSQNYVPRPSENMLDNAKSGTASQTPLRGSISQTAERPNATVTSAVKPQVGVREPGSVSLAEVAARANATVETRQWPEDRAPVRPQSETGAFGTSDAEDRRETARSTKPSQPDRPAIDAGRLHALVSSEVGNRVSASFDNLNKAISSGPPRSFNEIAEEMLRPMLREWLEDNLPMLVERLVREEIERLARGH